MISTMFSEFVEFVQRLYGTTEFIPLHAPRFEGNERNYVLDTLESTFVSSIGEYVTKFETAIAKYVGCNFAIATVNGTAALHTALKLGGVRYGDEVITQSLTFVATCNAIRYCGADPVFLDVERKTLGMSPIGLEEFLVESTELRDDGACWNKFTGRRIGACLPVHSFGHPARIDEIRKLCRKFNLVLIEDAAESLGSYYKNCHTGLFGEMGTVSFNGNKIITTGGGGIIITDDQEIARRAKHITATAKIPHPWLFLHDEVGYNYRMPNINAALGCAQLEVIDDYIKRKRELANQYYSWFEERGYELYREPMGAKSNYWINAVVTESREERDRFLQYTNDHDVMTRPLWTPMHTLQMYENDGRTDLTNTEWLESRLVNIPSSVI